MVTWKDVPGWFDFGDIYAEAVAEARPDAHFVEVGAAFGRSACFMGEAIRASGKPIRFDVIDAWGDAQVRRDFEANTRACGVRNYILPWWGTWEEFVPRFRLAECDLVFLDADHSYKATAAAIWAWLPKVRPGGVLAGHDFTDEHPGVIRAVAELLPGAVRRGSSFFWRVPA